MAEWLPNTSSRQRRMTDIWRPMTGSAGLRRSAEKADPRYRDGPQNAVACWMSTEAMVLRAA